jgi:hypothetical protein
MLLELKEQELELSARFGGWVERGSTDRDTWLAKFAWRFTDDHRHSCRSAPSGHAGGKRKIYDAFKKIPWHLSDGGISTQCQSSVTVWFRTAS